MLLEMENAFACVSFTCSDIQNITPTLGKNFLLGQSAGELLVCLGFPLRWRMWAFGQVKEVFWESSGQTLGVSVKNFILPVTNYG